MRQLLLAAVLLTACADVRTVPDPPEQDMTDGEADGGRFGSRAQDSGSAPDGGAAEPDADAEDAGGPQETPDAAVDAAPVPEEDGGAAPGPDGAAPAPGPIDVWLALGESGMQGHGDPAELGDLLPGYPESTLLVMRAGGLQPLAEPTADGAWPDVGVGPAGIFARAVSEACERRVAVVNVAVAAAKSSAWLPEDASGLYERALNRLTDALKAPHTRFAGVLLFDGLSTANVTSLPTWAEDWEAVQQALRADLGDVVDGVPWIYTSLRGVPQIYAHTHTVIAQQTAWESAERVQVQLPDGPWVGNDLTTAGNVELAGRYADAFDEHFGCGD